MRGTSRKRMLMTSAALTLALAATACGAADPDAETDAGSADSTDAASQDLSGSIAVSGSSTVEPISALNAELFRELDGNLKNGMRHGYGKAMEAVDRWGTAFNSLWKPMQLFRLAWPQRVLMDEWFRGMAQLGATEWMRTYGTALRAASLNAINPHEHPMTHPGAALMTTGGSVFS